MTIRIEAVQQEHWPNIQSLFGKKGACGGCWCMYWRLTHKEYEENKGERNRQAMKTILSGLLAPGLLAYKGKEPMGWCSLGPREAFPRLARSRILKPIDGQPVWSLVCLFVAKPYRRVGISRALISAAADYAKSQSAKILEAYPVEPNKPEVPPVFAFTGIASAFKACGFKEAARRSPTRPVMRLSL